MGFTKVTKADHEAKAYVTAWYFRLPNGEFSGRWVHNNEVDAWLPLARLLKKLHVMEKWTDEEREAINDYSERVQIPRE